MLLESSVDLDSWSDKSFRKWNVSEYTCW